MIFSPVANYVLSKQNRYKVRLSIIDYVQITNFKNLNTGTEFVHDIGIYILKSDTHD